MRVSTMQFFQQGLRQIQQRNAELSKTQEQLATGERIRNPSDDPATSGRLVQIDEALVRNRTYENSLSNATANLGQSESVLSDIGNILQRVREISVQAGDGIYTGFERENLAVEIRQLRDEVEAVANSRDGQGNYLFAGSKTTTLPFLRSGGTITYQGDGEIRQINAGDGRKLDIAASGDALFFDVPKGNGDFFTDQAGNTISSGSNEGTGIIDLGTVVDRNDTDFGTDFTIEFQTDPSDPEALVYTITNDGETSPPTNGPNSFDPESNIVFNGISVGFQGEPANGDTFSVTFDAFNQRTDVFTVLDDIIDNLEAGAGSEAEEAVFRQKLGQGLANLDQGMKQIITERTRLGEDLRSVELQSDYNQARIVQFESLRADLSEVDFAEAVTRLTLESTALQAAQQSFASVQQLSLFRFI